MKTVHDVLQNSDEWHRLRAEHGGASEAAAMLGIDPIVSRADLLRAKHTTIPREFSDWLQRHVLDKGHEVEELARPYAEAFIGEPLYQTYLSDGYPSASPDGLTLDDRIVWECKQWSEERAACLRSGRLPDKDMPQVQQEMMLAGADRCLFTVTDGTPERMLHLWVDPDPAWHQRLREGWSQFERDLADYTLPETANPVIAATVESLPALAVRMDGSLVVRSNLPAFGAALRAFIERIPQNPSTDQEFADTERACKILKLAEDELDRAEAGALASIADVETMRRLKRDYWTMSRDVRLMKERLVERRKTEIKERAVVAAFRALEDHVATLNAEIAPMCLPKIRPDFAGAIKSKRSIESMQDALDTTLAAAKIEADAAARVVRANLFAYHAKAKPYDYLFADLSTLVHKPESDFCALIDARIANHKAAEAAKEQARQAEEAARIAAAEQRAREHEASRIAQQKVEDARVAELAKQRRKPQLPTWGWAESSERAAVKLAASAAPAPPPAPVASPAANDMALKRKLLEQTRAMLDTNSDEESLVALGQVIGTLGDLLSVWTGEVVRVRITAEGQPDRLDMVKRPPAH